MKCSLQHLKDLIPCDLSPEEIGHKLTMAGLELEGISPVAPDFSFVVIGKIEEAQRHPDADKLQVCKVNIGKNNSNPADFLQIVCGAKNARVGLYVAVAQVGAVLPKDFKIKDAKIRGVESFGMLCSKSELGLAESSEGILELDQSAKDYLGVFIRDFLKLEDVILEVDITPNRGDCASVLGIARELAAALGENPPLCPTSLWPVGLYLPPGERRNQSEQSISPDLNIHIENFTDCPKYLGRIIRNINLNAKTPLWMENYLNRAGQRCIHPVVDITNYVMLTLGQPLHAFDLNYLENLSKEIVIRRSRNHEKIVLLDQQEINLTGQLIISAGDNTPVALAGIMGGLNSAVTDQTQHVFLESAHFSIQAISGEARALGLNTDASYRFERGVDPSLPERAMDLASDLILKICGGELGLITQSIDSNYLRQGPRIRLRLSRVWKILGLDLSSQEVRKILEKLSCTIELESKEACSDVFLVQGPSYRFDLNIEEDLIEEVARIYGLDNLNPSLPESFIKPIKSFENLSALSQIKNYFVSRGYHECINYSFIDPKFYNLIFGDLEYLNKKNILNFVANPISEDLSLMRTSLIPGLLKSAMHNLLRQAERVRLFEQGRVFIGHTEIEKLAGLLAGKRVMVNPHDHESVDFYDLKGDLEALLSELNTGLEFKNIDLKDLDFLHPGRSAKIFKNGQYLGYIGQVHPRVQKLLDSRVALYIFELDLGLAREIEISEVQAISKYPSISRDLALVLDKNIQAEEVISFIKKIGGEFVKSVHVFDVYQGDHIPEGKKSLALNLILQALSHTLSDPEIQGLVSEIVKKISQEFSAELRV